ncbi:MAG TPA: hypothetical protein VJ742_12525 [Nitrososphaera sp.]|nr:hypothetical protein [Nitrososphaera sp.]
MEPQEKIGCVESLKWKRWALPYLSSFCCDDAEVTASFDVPTLVRLFLRELTHGEGDEVGDEDDEPELGHVLGLILEQPSGGTE